MAMFVCAGVAISFFAFSGAVAQEDGDEVEAKLTGEQEKSGGGLTRTERLALACGVFFFLGFFVAVTAQLKAEWNVCRAVRTFVRTNHVLLVDVAQPKKKLDSQRGWVAVDWAIDQSIDWLIDWLIGWTNVHCTEWTCILKLVFRVLMLGKTIGFVFLFLSDFLWEGHFVHLAFHHYRFIFPLNCFNLWVAVARPPISLNMFFRQSWLAMCSWFRWVWPGVGQNSTV